VAHVAQLSQSAANRAVHDYLANSIIAPTSLKWTRIFRAAVDEAGSQPQRLAQPPPRGRTRAGKGRVHPGAGGFPSRSTCPWPGGRNWVRTSDPSLV